MLLSPYFAASSCSELEIYFDALACNQILRPQRRDVGRRRNDSWDASLLAAPALIVGQGVVRWRRSP